MKILKFVVLFLILFGLSCSSDDGADENLENSIEGVWVLTGLTPDEESSTGIFQEILALNDLLPVLNCYLITLDVHDNNSVTVEIFEFDEIEGSDSNNPIYECTDGTTANATWTLEDNILTFTTSDGLSESIMIILESDRLILKETDAFGFYSVASEELIFERLLQV